MRTIHIYLPSTYIIARTCLFILIPTWDRSIEGVCHVLWEFPQVSRLADVTQPDSREQDTVEADLWDIYAWFCYDLLLGKDG